MTDKAEKTDEGNQDQKKQNERDTVERRVMLKRDALILANARMIIKATRATLNWHLVMQLFGTGSTSAWDKCVKLGLDPDSNKTNYSEMIKHLEA